MSQPVVPQTAASQATPSTARKPATPAGPRPAVRVVIFVLTLGLCLAAGEIFLRIKNSSMKNYDIEMWRYGRTLKVRSDNPALGHEHALSTSEVLQSVEIRTNEYGLRGGPVAKIAPGERRILFLGSSCTLGWGVAEEKTTTARLEKRFKDDGQNVTVLNAGIGNYNAPRYVERFLTKLTALDPTDIVVHGFVRDAEPIETSGGNWLLRNSQLAVVLWTAVQQRLASGGGGTLEDHYRRVYEGPGFKAMDDSLKRLSDYAREKGIRLHFAMTPDVHNLHDYKLHFVHDAVKGLAEKHGFRYLDLFPAFEGLKAEQVWAMPGDPHPNALGHEKMAERIYPFLRADTLAQATK